MTVAPSDPVTLGRFQSGSCLEHDRPRTSIRHPRFGRRGEWQPVPLPLAVPSEQGSGRRSGRSGELPAGSVDLAPSRVPHGHSHPLCLELADEGGFVAGA